MKRVDPETGLIEQVYEDERGLHVHRTDTGVQSLLDRNKMMAELAPSMKGPAATRYVGSVDGLTAENWSRECGAAVGTPEFAAYAKKKLLDGDNAKFRVKGF